LHTWAANRRKEKKKGRLSAERTADLEAIPEWRWDPSADRFEAGLAALRSYVERFGDARVPSGFVAADGFKLGQWVGERRKDRNNQELSEDRVAKLEAFPRWSWDPAGDDYAEAVNLLRQYAGREGHARVLRGFIAANGLDLGKWVSRQRQAATKGDLSLERRAALDGIEGWTWD
jgi:hypothetical protein